MSRCFPFPPPGYEKKIRTDEADSLIKEKQKKHKKEKKDKETSKDKHKERKEKKDKHKDRKDKDRNKEKSRTSEDRKAAGVLPNTQDGEKLVRDTLQSNGNGESKFIQDLARRIRDEEEATESQSGGKIRNDDERRINKNFAMERRPENVSSCSGQKGTEEVMFKPLEKKDQAKKMELQEKNHRRGSVIVADMPLDSKKTEPKYTTHRGSKEEETEALNKTGQGKPKDVEEGPKLKERHNGSRPNKMLRPVASPVSSVENGRKLGECQTPLKPVTELQGTLCNPEAKEHRVNGFIKSQEPKSHPSISSVKAKENGEASAKKRPHSDLKYLDQILNVPERDEVDETEGQEWLFGQSGMKVLKKPKTDSTTTALDETLQVWNQALSIESADIVALPYVVPF
ncbi:hypothetical protein HID58_095610 [Brassica napus]|uniref:Uncharacterized protein n=1 Tax=Brassica napus TaxID=3708 RepID=A0ABQ7X326_BRANA|nr:hypothetical protein HID58_095610 [Brassica napus]